MNFFVTGATGFLGQYMLRELLKFGHNIFVKYNSVYALCHNIKLLSLISPPVLIMMSGSEVSVT